MMPKVVVGNRVVLAVKEDRAEETSERMEERKLPPVELECECEWEELDEVVGKTVP